MASSKKKKKTFWLNVIISYVKWNKFFIVIYICISLPFRVLLVLKVLKDHL